MKSSGANTVGAYDAKTHFSELLERVARGEEITITRHGSPVARLVPARPTPPASNRQEAILMIRQLAARNRLTGLSVDELKLEGRR
ncbi:MAG: type II toxin-antitoxin system Phd/YefM family antitoxin [Candidatus Riflebacteria bacterium]|nr:type II toxin-antitoxin system Phd/YefM family antitoxin [Candidatus Riflebacteria bacterium]